MANDRNHAPSSSGSIVGVFIILCLLLAGSIYFLHEQYRVQREQEERAAALRSDILRHRLHQDAAVSSTSAHTIRGARTHTQGHYRSTPTSSVQAQHGR